MLTERHKLYTLIFEIAWKIFLPSVSLFVQLWTLSHWPLWACIQITVSFSLDLSWPDSLIKHMWAVGPFLKTLSASSKLAKMAVNLSFPSVTVCWLIYLWATHGICLFLIHCHRYTYIYIYERDWNMLCFLCMWVCSETSQRTLWETSPTHAPQQWPLKHCHSGFPLNRGWVWAEITEVTCRRTLVLYVVIRRKFYLDK